MMGMTGNTMLDNCTIDTAFEGDSNLLRLRLLNDSNALSCCFACEDERRLQMQRKRWRSHETPI